MRVILADAMGLCFGVRDALGAIEAIGRPEAVTIHGELVHNEAVLARLDARGFRRTDEADREGLPATPTVLITAHGVSEAERRRLEGAGKGLVDTTCPLVVKAHAAARRLHDRGHFVLIIGKRGHVEVRGIVGDLEHFEVIQDAGEVRRYPSDRLGVVCQTTTAPRTVGPIRAAIVARNPGAEVRFIDTICQPTKDRQQALDRLIDQVDAMVVVGGRNSNNTRELAALCRERGVVAYHVQGPDDLDPDWFAGREAVGLTAGTSTLDETIAAVHRSLREMNAGGRP